MPTNPNATSAFAKSSRQKLTKSVVDNIPHTSTGQSFYWDTELTGFGLRVGQKSKAYFAEWRVQGRTVRVTIGKHGPFVPESARKKALVLLAEMQCGTNPNNERKKAKARGVTLEDAFEDFLKARKSLKANTIRDYRYCVEHYFASWRSLPLLSITREKIASHHTAQGKISPARANLAMRFLRALFNFSIQQYEPHITDNPVRHLSLTRAWYRVERRQQYIKPHQISAWFKAVMNLKKNEKDQKTALFETYRDYLLLVLFTGLRREEAAGLTWECVDLKDKTLTVTDTKNHEDHVLPLSNFLFDLLSTRRKEIDLETKFVFPGEGRTGHVVEPRKQILRVCRESGVQFRTHDLRRTFATIAESLDIPAYALKRLLNHKNGNDVTAGYVIADVERLRAPMQRVTDFILNAAKATPAVDSILAIAAIASAHPVLVQEVRRQNALETA